jgi:uncharacterized protein (TIGR03067 family)
MWRPVLQRAATKGPEEQARLLALFEKGTDLESLLAMKPKELFVSSMNGLKSQFPHVTDSVAGVDSEIIGTVREGDDRAYVVVRSRIKHTEVSKVEVISLKRSGTEWKTLLPEVVQVMAEMFKRTQQPEPLKSGPVTKTANPEPAEDAAKKDLQMLQGTWVVVEARYAGKSIEGFYKNVKWIFSGDQVKFSGVPKEVEARFKLDPTQKPKVITFIVPKGQGDDPGDCIYEIDGDVLKIGTPGVTGKKPKDFTDEGAVIITFKREPSRAEQLFQELEARLAKAETIQGKYKAALEFKGENAGERGHKLEGALWLQKGNKLRLEMDGILILDPVKGAVVSDGAVMQYQDRGKGKSGRDKTPANLNSTFTGALAREGLLMCMLTHSGGGSLAERIGDEIGKERKPPAEFKLRAKEKIGDVETDVIEFRIDLGEKILGHVTLWLDAQTHLPVRRHLKIEIEGRDGGHLTESYEGLKLDEKIDPAKFNIEA